MQAFHEAADGIRTHDLLHGKQGVCFPFGADIPCKCMGSRVSVSLRDSPAFTASSLGFGHRMGTRPRARLLLLHAQAEVKLTTAGRENGLRPEAPHGSGRMGVSCSARL